MSADTYAKLWVQDNLNTLATTRALEAIQEGNGWSLPCSVTAVNGSLVTVSFQVAGPWTLPPLTLPRAESQWIRNPTQAGDFGLTVPMSTFHGGVSGIGSGVADMTVDYGNLTRLVFLPIGNVNFAAIPDPNKAWINGPAGAVVSDTAQTAVITAAHNLITLAAPSGTVQLQGSGTTPGDALVRQSDLANAISALCTAIQVWATTHFSAASAGSGWTGTGPIAPTVTGSTKSFSG